MSESFASPEDIEGIWRPLSEAETIVATNRLAQASEYIRQQFRLARRDADAEIASGRLSSKLLQGITVDMAHRVMLNPEKLRSDMRSIDDWQRSRTLDNAISAGEIYLSDNELALLGLPKPGRGKAFSIRPDPGPVPRRRWPSRFG